MGDAIAHKPLSPFGAEVRIDDPDAISRAQENSLRQLLREEGLVLIRGLSLSMDAQKKLCSIFGPVLQGAQDNFLISNVAEGGLFADMELTFHTDVPYVPAPFMAASLHALEVTEGVSATKFASGLRAYEGLPPRLRERIDSLNAMFVRPRTIDRRTKLTDLVPTDNCAVHAVAGLQEATGRRYIYVNTSSTGCIIGLSESESDALLEELFSHLYAPDNVYEHVWQEGDLIVWDNLAVQHARARIARGRRTLQRVTLGLLGYWEQYPVDNATYQELQRGRGWLAKEEAI
jgi:taurine dioxygenase